jgi:phosphoglycerol transferase MdoB-like AlkP superfamily enzyme
VLQEFCQWLLDSRLGIAVAEDWFPKVECVHVIALATVVGTIFIVDTRLIGLTSSRLSFRAISSRLLPWTWAGFILAVITGFMLFASNAVAYAANGAFRLKLLLMILAALNMLYFELVTFRNVAIWESAAKPPFAARLAGTLSVMLWCGVIVTGRWIGFSL